MKLRFSFFLLFFFGFNLIAGAQNLPNVDWQNIDVDQISEQQIQRLDAAARKRGLTPNQVAQLAIQRGMPQSEARKLRDRLNNVRSEPAGKYTGQQDRLRYSKTDSIQPSFFDSFFGADSTRDSLRFYQSIELLKYRTKQDSIALRKQKLKNKIFGFSLFSNKSTTFEPALNIPTPVNYQLGAGDELIIDIYGASERTYQLKVSPDGMVNIQNIGPIYVSGLTIEEAKKRLRNQLGQIYSGLNPANESNKDTYMQLTLGQNRSIKVSVIGEVSRPGTYTVSSLATVFNALYSAGGPTVTGSFRNINVIRGDTIVSTFDLYDLLINGDQSSNIRLRDQDIIQIEPYEKRVEIQGEVKRPGIYEMNGSETLADLLDFVGGFTGDAYTKRIKIVGSTDRQRRINDVAKKNFDDFVMKNGDLVTVNKVLDRFKNIVEIKGAVFREGKYEITDTTTVRSLIKRAEGLRGDAFQNRGLIYREQEDYTLKTVSFNVKRVMQNPEYDIPLKKNDLVVISSIFDLRDDYFVEIEGAIQDPDKYKYADGMTLQDLIFQADGFRQNATPYRIEVARRVTNIGGSLNSSQIADIFTFSVDKNLSLSPDEAGFELKPFDKVYVREAPNYTKQKEVTIAGQVNYPGTYTLKTKDDRISDIIERAGGLTQDAYIDGATLFRKLDRLELRGNKDEEDIEGFYTQKSDSLQKARQNKPDEITISKIGIQLPKILENPGSKYDLFVQKGDSLFVPKNLQTVNVKGGVFYPTSIRYDNDLTYKDYITAAGGYNELAKDNKSYIVYANGEVDRVKRFLFFKDYPKVKPGATLVVPEKERGEGLSAQERIAIYSAIVSTVAVISTTIFQIAR